MENFYMVWVAGRGAPTRVYASQSDALDRAETLRREFTGREVYVLAPSHCLQGRPIIEIRDGESVRAQKVAKPIVTVKKRRVLAPA